MVKDSVDNATGMHPVIRILSFLALVATLARARFPFILLVDGVFLLFAWCSPADIFGFVWRLMRRMRWFWLSIILLYTLMTPGGGHTLVIGSIELSEGGLLLGLERCLALLSVLLFFALLIHTTPTSQLQSALHWLLRPLARLGLPSDKLSVRISLTLQKIHALQIQWSDRSKSTPQLKDWREIPAKIAAFIEEVFVCAETEPAEQQLTLETHPPSITQWLLLLCLLSLLVGLRFYLPHAL